MKLWMTGLLAIAPFVVAQSDLKILRFTPDALQGKTKSTKNGETSEHQYYKSAASPRIETGVWSAKGFKGAAVRKATSTEFIHVVAGTITLADAEGKEHIFKAGDDLLIPRGANVQWKNTEDVIEYYAIFDLGTATENLSTAEPQIMRLSKDGPEGKGLVGRGKTKEHMYLKTADASMVGVWETQPDTRAEFTKNKYAELMLFVSGNVTLSTPSGQTETFHAGDVALVPKGLEYKWSSDTARKFYVIFDSDPKTEAPAK